VDRLPRSGRLPSLRYRESVRRQIDHVTIRVRDGAAADTFYGAVLRTLGFRRDVDQHGRVSFGTDEGHEFGFYSHGNEFFKRAHVAFAAPTREAVDRFHQAAVEAGGASVDEPRVRPEFGGLYSAYVSDPDGLLVEVAYEASA
jgi:catechol 2,3-dioxygenase-like lactoylglutathione lyase family enzyme